MTKQFQKLTADSYPTFIEYANLRPTFVAERQFVNQFIWSGFYHSEYYTNDTSLFFKIQVLGEPGTFVPLCKKDDILSSFYAIKDYFNQELNLPLKMYLADKEFISVLETDEAFMEQFDIIEYRDGFDYIYDAEKLRTLSGRKLHKKKNHLNHFLKNYDGRYEYRRLCCSNMDEVKDFHNEWLSTREITDKNNSIDKEEEGIYRLMAHCSEIDYRCGGVYIDGKLQAYTIGSYDLALRCAFIHIEKANTQINGLYNFINQQFLLHEFPNAEFVNREDDLGQEGLRKSKLSYQPIRLESKYHIFQKQ